MKIITALGNPTTNEKLNKETRFEIIGNDIQYKEGVIEVLESNDDIDLLIISEILPGEIEFKKIIEKIISIKQDIEIITILENKNDELKNYLISKGIFNIFYNNEITNENLIKIIKEIENIKKENKMNEEIKKLKNIILEQEKEKILKNKIKEKYLKIKNKILGKIKSNKTKIKTENKVISITGTSGAGKSILSALIAKTIRNKKILLIDFDIFQQSLNSIFNCKKIKTEKKKNKIKNNLEKLIVNVDKNIDLLSAIDFLFDENYKIEKNKIKNLLEDVSKKYDEIIIDTTSECFFDYTKEILENSNLIFFLAQSNLIELKKSKNLLNIYINKWKINTEKIKIIFNKENINSIDDKILKTLFSDFQILGKIKTNKNFNLIINNNLKIINKKITKQIKAIIKKGGI